MASPRILCLDIAGSMFIARLMLKFDKESQYTMTGTGTLGGGPVPLTVESSPCDEPPGQEWTCEVTSADATHANYTLRSEGKTIKSFVETGACGIPDPLPCDE